MENGCEVARDGQGAVECISLSRDLKSAYRSQRDDETLQPVCTVGSGS